MAPTKRAANTLGSVTSMTSVMPLACSQVVLKAAKRARAVSAAEPMAKPFPMAAVVLPTASSLSVRWRTSAGNSLISAMPPALSEMGPYASTASWMPVLESIPTAAMAMP